MCNRKTRGEERESEMEEVLQVIMTNNFPKLRAAPDPEVQKTPNKTNYKKKNSILRYVIFKLQLTKDTEKLLMESREKKKPFCRRTRAIITVDFSLETM